MKKEAVRAVACNVITAGMIGVLREMCRTRNGSPVVNASLRYLLTPGGISEFTSALCKAPFAKNFIFSGLGGLTYGLMSALTYQFLSPDSVDANDPQKKTLFAILSSAALLGTLVTSWGLQHSARIRNANSLYEHVNFNS